MSLEITNLQDRIGSEIRTDVANLLTPDVAAEVRRLLLERGVLVFKELHLADEQQVTLAAFSPVSPRVRGAEETRFIMQRLRSAGVKISSTTYIKQIGDHEVTVFDVYSEQERVIAGVDAVVLSTSRMSVNDLEKALEDKVSQLFIIGDAAAARMWAASTYEGHMFARLIGEPSAPKSLAEVYHGKFDMTTLPYPADLARA